MIDTEALRSKIMDLAIRGKLTEQLPEDGRAEDLYAKIQEEKAQLVKGGKIKKEKALPEIMEDEIPFEIPENWKWVRWGELSNSIQYGYNAPAKNEGKIRMVRISDIHDNNVDWDNVPYCDIEDDEIEAYQLKENDILFARTGGTVGKSYIVQEIPERAVFAGYLIRSSYSMKLYPMYMKFFMESNLYWKQLRNGTIATAQPNCNGKTLSKMMLPLPPAAEQKRIIDKVNDILERIDEIENLQSQYASNVEILKGKLIDASIRGKLTEQLPEDGFVKELVNSICSEINTIIEKEEQAFEIPENWYWIKLGWVIDIERGGSPRPIKSFLTNDIDGINWIKIGDVEKDGKYITSTKEKIKPEGEKKSRRVYPGDFLLTNSMSFGRPYISKITGCVHDGWLILRNSKGMFDLDFLYLLLSSTYVYNQFSKKASGATVDNLNIDKVLDAIIPLPPLSEQKRIVKEIDALLNVFD